MEMQEIPKELEKGKEGDEGLSEPVLEVKKEEEAEPDHYAKLQIPSEDIYSEALSDDGAGKKAPGKEPTEGNVRLYRAMCLFLTLMCMVLLVVVIILSLKLQTGSTVCPSPSSTVGPVTKETTMAQLCTLEHCLSLFPTIHIKHYGCRQCADGWMTFGRSCFFLSTFRLNWHQSKQNCTSRGGSLAVISSKGIQDFLTMKGNLQYWIGTSEKDNEWTWVNNTKLQESYWAENPRTGNCGILDSTGPSSKNWIRAPCNVATYFICQLQIL